MENVIILKRKEVIKIDVEIIVTLVIKPNRFLVILENGSMLSTTKFIPQMNDSIVEKVEDFDHLHTLLKILEDSKTSLEYALKRADEKHIERKMRKQFKNLLDNELERRIQRKEERLLEDYFNMKINQ